MFQILKIQMLQKLRERMHSRQVYNQSVCNCHEDSELVRMMVIICMIMTTMMNMIKTTDNKNADKRFIKLAFSCQSSTWLNRSTLLLTRQVAHSIGSDCRVRESHIWIFILLSSYNVDLVTSILIIFAHKFVFISLVF